MTRRTFSDNGDPIPEYLQVEEEMSIDELVIQDQHDDIEIMKQALQRIAIIDKGECAKIAQEVLEKIFMR